VQALGLSTATSWAEIGFQLLTGSSLLIYYFIFILTWCILLTWPLSRAPRGFVPPALVGLLAATIVCEVYGRRAPGDPIGGGLSRGHLVWLTEFYLYPLAYFLIGWLAASRRDAWRRFAAEHALGLVALCLLGVGVFLAGDPWTETFMPAPSAARAVYTLCVIGILARTPAAVARLRPLRFLSEATLGIYLYHRFFQMAAKPSLEAWPPLALALALAVVGLVGASCLCLAGRRLLGPRARLLLGA
jgi:peptidoglycan/LPS O-acetylase OafA/YrhL